MIDKFEEIVRAYEVERVVEREIMSNN